MGNIELLIAKNNKLHKPKKNSGINKPNIPATVRMVSAKLPFRSALKIPSKQPKKLIGLDGSGSNGRITYVSDNGEEKILKDSGRLNLFDLFEKLN